MNKVVFCILLNCIGFLNIAHASVSKMTCQVFYITGEHVTEPIRFVASSRTSHPLPVVDNRVLYLRWTYYTEAVSVSLVENPDYPWNLPWRTKIISRGKIENKIDGKIIGSFDLSVIQDGMYLTCEQDIDR